MHIDSFITLSKYVSVMSEENEVSLVVEGNDSSALELRILREQRGKEPANFETDFGVKVVENEFRNVLSCHTMMLDILLERQTRDLEHTQHSFKMPDKQLIPSVVVPYDHNMGVIKVFGTSVDLIQLHIFPGVVINIVKDHHQFAEVFINLFGGLDRGREQDLDWGLLIEVLLELIELSFVVFIQVLFTSLLFVFDGDGFLSLCGW